MTDEDFFRQESNLEAEVEAFIEACEEAGFDPTDRLLDILYKNGIEV
jgi:hypothetical protein